MESISDISQFFDVSVYLADMLWQGFCSILKHWYDFIVKAVILFILLYVSSQLVYNRHNFHFSLKLISTIILWNSSSTKCDIKSTFFAISNPRLFGNEIPGNLIWMVFAERGMGIIVSLLHLTIIFITKQRLSLVNMSHHFVHREKVAKGIAHLFTNSIF